MTRAIIYKPRARRDLAGIWSYSAETWSAKRADEYIDAFDSAMSLINEFPSIARDASQIKPGLLRYEVGSHVIYFRVDKSSLTVLRILHDRMEPKRHL